MSGILEGVRVLEMGHVVAAPSASVMLADWGADVIKLEPLTGDLARGIYSAPKPQDGVQTAGPVSIGWYFQVINRGKRSIALNLKEKNGQDVLGKLICWADIFMTNYEVNALEKLEADYETLSKINPRIVYGLITGYGTKGPDKDQRGFDYSAGWARSGLMYMMGEPGSIPPPQRGGVIDRVTGAYMACGVLAALVHRDRTGQGQKVESSLYQCGVWTDAEDMQFALMGGEPTHHNRTTAWNPLWNNYHTKDDKWFWAAMLQPDLSWGNFCHALGHPEWENDQRFSSIEQRIPNREELIRLIDEVLQSKSMAEWEVIFRRHDIIYGRVASPKEVINDPQALENNFFVNLHHPSSPETKVVMTPMKFVQNQSEVKRPAPEIGQHTEEILLEMGYAWKDIALLKEKNIIL
jgi:crotonobetainyl-CoA:carnitine CoA-transferase CaiB-like acyl-CoA transferase